MRLLSLDIHSQVRLTEFDDTTLPAYAILSHTWGPAEVSFNDLFKSAEQSRNGYRKIRFCLDRAKADGLQYCWIDTCCIDRGNHYELSEAINAMFRWYQNAAKCYVYLSDIPEVDFNSSRWFTRGWTLQELLAPQIVEFFSSEGRKLGDKVSLLQNIHKTTQIPITALQGQALADFSFNERISWATQRETRLEEDKVYSLLGICGVSMIPHYGEGRERANSRLLQCVQENLTSVDQDSADVAISQGFTVPFGLPGAPVASSFTGRANEISQIQQWLSAGNTRKTIVLCGLGGVGKTQLAIEFARRQRHEYTAVFWMDGRNESFLQQSFATAARRVSQAQPSHSALKLAAKSNDLIEATDALRHWLDLSGNSQWLLIVDNVDEPHIPGVVDGAYDIRRYLPTSFHGHVLITTRSSYLRIGKQLRIQTIRNEKECLEILQAYSQRLHIEHEYLNQYERSWQELQQTSPSLLEYEGRLLTTTWETSFRQIEKRNPEAYQLLELWTFFANQDIWYELLRAGRSEAPEWFFNITSSYISFNYHMRILCDYGLVEVQQMPTGYTLQSCVHSWAREVASRDNRDRNAKLALRCISLIVPTSDQVEYRVTQRRLLNHADSLIKQFTDGSHVHRDYKYLCRLGYFYFDLGELVKAELIYTEVLNGFEKTVGQDHTSTLEVVSSLGDLYRKQGKLVESEAMFLRALEGFEKVFGQEHTSTLQTATSLGDLYRHQGKLADAEVLYVQAHRRNPSGDVPQTFSLGKRVPSDHSNDGEPIQLKRIRHDFESLSDDERRTRLLNSLYFNKMGARQLCIQNPHSGTCCWLLKDSHYLQWMNNANKKILWIKGKPGSGKSTLMKFAFTNAQKQAKDDIILSFFFNNRGCELEKSTLGLYRTLLVQLLQQIPEIHSKFALDPSIFGSTTDRQWDIGTLKQLLSNGIQASKLRSIFLFVDALDECNEHEIRVIISHFEELVERNFSNQEKIRICLSSRYYPHITIKSELELSLEAKEAHTKDIELFLRSQLKIGNGKPAEYIRHEVIGKASHLFLWAVLATRILNAEYDKGQVYNLQRRLTEGPSDLYLLFSDVLQRGSLNRDLTLICVQWILFAKTPLTPKQMYSAIHSKINSVTVSQLNSAQITTEIAQRYLLSISGGLTETTISRNPTVQFIHESVREFLLKGDGLSRIWPDVKGNIEGQCQYQLADCCIKYLCTDSNRYFRHLSALPTFSSKEASTLRNSINDAYPFLDYAVNNVLYHAEKAAENGFTHDILQSVEPSDLEHWIKLANILERCEHRRYNPDQSLVHILAHRGYPNLLRQRLESNLDLDKPSECRYEDLKVAVEQGFRDVVEILLNHNSNIKFRGNIRGLYRSFSDAVRKGQTDIIELLVNSEIADHPDFVKLSNESISTAAQLGFKQIVEILSAKSVSAYTPSTYCSAGPSATVYRGRVEIEQSLHSQDEVGNGQARVYSNATQAAFFLRHNGIMGVTYDPLESDSLNLFDEEALLTSVPATPTTLISRPDQEAAAAITLPQQSIRLNQCPDCDRRFSRATDLRRHKTSIHGPKIHGCPEPTCDRKGENAFRRKDHLKEHINRKHGYRMTITERISSFPTSPQSTELTPNDSTSKAEKKTRFNNSYGRWQYSLFRSHGIEICEACRRKHTACHLSHINLKDLSHIPQASWNECPEPDRLRSEVPSEIHNLPPTN